jgi:multidrug resistance efflux pump
MYNKHIPHFFKLLIIIIAITIIGLIVGSAFITKPFVVLASGVVSIGDENYIMPLVSGTIKNIEVIEGQKIEEGDILIQLDTSEIDINISQIESTIEKLSMKIELYDRLIDYINNEYSKDDEINSFDKENIDELEFYNYMSMYEIDKSSYEGNEVGLQSLKIQTINSYLVNRETYVDENIEYEAQKDVYLQNKENYSIKANMAGIVHLANGLSLGMVLQAGDNIGSIYDEEEEMTIECYILASDRPKVELNDEVDIAIDGLIQNEYGVLTGNLISIDSDVTDTDDGSYYIGEVQINQNYLVSSKEEIVNLEKGMQGEVRVKYEQTSYLYYFLDELGIDIKK